MRDRRRCVTVLRNEWRAILKFCKLGKTMAEYTNNTRCIGSAIYIVTMALAIVVTTTCHAENAQQWTFNAETGEFKAEAPYDGTIPNCNNPALRDAALNELQGWIDRNGTEDLKDIIAESSKSNIDDLIPTDFSESSIQCSGNLTFYINKSDEKLVEVTSGISFKAERAKNTSVYNVSITSLSSTNKNVRTYTHTLKEEFVGMPACGSIEVKREVIKVFLKIMDSEQAKMYCLLQNGGSCGKITDVNIGQVSTISKYDTMETCQSIAHITKIITVYGSTEPRSKKVEGDIDCNYTVRMFDDRSGFRVDIK